MLYLILCLALSIAGSLASTTLCISNEDTASSCSCSKTYNVSRQQEISVNTSDSRIHFCSVSIVFNEVIVTLTNSSNLVIGSTTKKTRIMGHGSSGFHLINVSNVSIHSLEFIDCGKAFVSGYSDAIAFAVILIEDSISITISNVLFNNNSGSGLIMLNIGGTSMLTACIFRNSTTTNANHSSNRSFFYTGALHIEMSTCGWSILKEKTVVCENANVIQNSTLCISECDFIDNHPAGKVRGGGLFIEMTGKSAGNHVTIKDCYFFNNSAYRGGGAYIRMDQNVLENTIEVINATFISNLSPSIGGGVTIGYAFNESLPSENKIILYNCNFQSNKAEIHAGVSIYSSSSSEESIMENSVQFRDCSWTQNSATSLGAALGVVAIYNRNINNNIIINKWFIEIVFHNATFESNYFSDDLGSSGGVRSGIVHITTIPVKFEGATTFDSNDGNALEVVSSTVNFQQGSQVTFKNNKASPNGAALNLIHTSEIALGKGCNFTFSNNTACSGAAIKQHTIDPYDFIHSRKCFIKYRGSALENNEQGKPSLVFINNTATCDGFGNSIHVTSIRPCNYTYKVGDGKCQPIFTNTSIFSCAASFEFREAFSSRTEITTDAKEIVVTSTYNNVSTIPGKEVNLPIYAVDEFNNALPVVYTVIVSNGSIILDSAYKYITYSRSKFYGKPGNQGTIHLTVNSARNQVEAYLKVTLSQCPPGFVLDYKNQACKCSTLAKHSQRYNCITECNETSNTALLDQDWWINFDDDYGNKTVDDEGRLLYGQCPEDHCLNYESNRYLKLSNEDKRLDDHFVCHPTRTNLLCSQCRENYTTHYHSSSHRCGDKSTCKIGWLLYVISELLPVTCLLLFIILFDIKMTTGAVNGFIYFAQTIDKIVLDDTSNYSASSKVTKVFLEGYALIVRMFNLNFFQLNATSYCLWDNAQTLDMIAFRYVTTVYSLLLVLLIIVTVHYCNARCLKKIVSKVRRKRLTARSTIVHGLTGFLVLSYSGFTNTSVNLMLSISLYSIGHKVKYTAVYYNGELAYLRGNHLYYVIPAIFVFITLGLLPPLLLISYPLCYRILSLLKLNESKFSHILCTYIPLEKIKPLFDSFQNSFKDEYRFFSGLYFIFRLSTLAIQAALGNTVYFYSAISVQSASIFALHAICRPYKKKQHNIIEGLFLFDITVIAITFSTLNIHFRKASIVGIQLVLLYLPLLIMAVYIGKNICQKVRRFKCFKKTEGASGYYQEFNDSILFREAENRLNDHE